MRTGPVSAHNERGPVAPGQGKELERNMDGGSHKAVIGVLGDRGWHLSLVTLPSSLTHPS